MGAFGIPLPESSDVSLRNSIQASSNLLSQIMARAAAKEQMDRLRAMMPFEQNLKLIQMQHALGAEARNQDIHNLRKEALIDAHKSFLQKNDPQYAINKFKALHEYIQGLKNSSSNYNDNNGNEIPQTGQTDENYLRYGDPEGSMVDQQITDYSPELTQNENTVNGSLKGIDEVLNSEQGNLRTKPFGKPTQQRAAFPNKKNGLDLNYIGDALQYKALGIPLPKDLGKPIINEEEKAQKRAQGKFQGESYGKAVDTSMALSNQEENLNRLADGLESNPDAKNVIGPVNQWASKYFGSPEDKAYLGEVMSETGNIVLDAAKNIKGAFTGRDQSLINSLKPNASDPYFLFVGKLKAMAEITQMARKRVDLYAKKVHDGIPANEALQQSIHETSLQPKEARYKHILVDAKVKSALQEGKSPTFSSKQEADEYLDSLPTKERIELLKHLSGR